VGAADAEAGAQRFSRRQGDGMGVGAQDGRHWK
jgi:hypothetical protein